MDASQPDNVVLSSDYIIKRILAALDIHSIGPSIYQSSIGPNGVLLRIRISNHGVNLSTWYVKNTNEIIPLKDSINVAITFLPNKQECEKAKTPFPPKAINKTSVYISKESRIVIQDSEEFTVEHYCYKSWRMDDNAVDLVIGAIKGYMINGTFEDPLKEHGNRAAHFSDTSNQAPKKVNVKR